MGSIAESGSGEGDDAGHGERRASIHFSDHVETIVYDTDDPLASPDAVQNYQARVLQLNYHPDGRADDPADDPTSERPEAAKSTHRRPPKARPRIGRRPSRGRGRGGPPADQARTVQQQFSMRPADGAGGGGGDAAGGATRTVSYPSKPPLVIPTIRIIDAEEDLRELFGNDYESMMDDQQIYDLFLDSSHEDEGTRGREEEQRREKEQRKRRRKEEEAKQRRKEEEQKQRRKEEEQKQKRKEDEKKQRRKERKKKRQQEKEPSSNKAENDFDDIRVSDPY